MPTLTRSACGELAKTGFNRLAFEKEYVCKDGRRIPVLISGALLDQDCFDGIAFVLDISDRKNAERSLRESEIRFKEMFRNHSAVMLLIEPETGAIIDANLAAETMYGYSYDQLVGMNIAEINISTPEEITRELNSAQYRQNNYFIFSHRKADGEIRTVEVHSTPIINNNAPLLFSIIHDITERRQAEIALKRSEHDLAAAQRISHVGSWRLSIGEDGEHWTGSEELYRIYGYPQTMPMTMQTGIERMHPDDRGPVTAFWSSAMTGSGPGNGNTGSSWTDRPNGSMSVPLRF